MSRQGWVTVDRRSLSIIGVLVLAILVPVVIWYFQAASMRSHFVQALRAGDIGGTPVDLRDKIWSEDELAEVEVLAVPQGAGSERAISRAAYTRGRVLLSSQHYAYQGTISDSSTGIRHVFGLPRRETRVWRWITIHPSSAERHIQRRQEELDVLKRRAKPG